MSGGGKVSPRQKMINMMYLVLLAMLALNVSREVLDAFININEGLESTTKSVNEQNRSRYHIFAEAFKKDQKKVGVWKDKADLLFDKSNKMVQYITDLKEKIVKAGDGPKGDVNNIQNKSTTEVSANILIGNELTGKSDGDFLKEEVIQFREFLINLVGDKGYGIGGIKATVAKELSTDDGSLSNDSKEKRPWKDAKFGHLPLAAVITILTDMQIKVRYTESVVLNHLFGMIDAGSHKVNKVEAVINFDKNYLLKGDKYGARIFLAARDTNSQPRVVIDGGKYRVGSDGRLAFTTDGSMVGMNSIKGSVYFKGPDGDEISRSFATEFEVAEPNVVISPTRMNAFYLGVANPISVSVPGVKAEDITVELKNGRKSRIGTSGTEYNVFPKKEGKSIVTVYANIGGVRQLLKTMVFRVFVVPDPVAQVGGKNQGKLSKNELLIEDGIFAVLEDFVFDMKFDIKEFTVFTTNGDFERQNKSKSNRFTKEQKKQIKGMRRGKKVYIGDIVAMGADGIKRPLPAIQITIK